MENRASGHDARPIGVFDSGLGGLTAVRKLRELLPGEDIIYLGDTGRVPYGGKSRETIQRYATEDIAFLRRFGIKAVVAACGTVSTNGIEEIAAGLDIPVFGVADAAARAAAERTKSGRIGLIGTLASIASSAYDEKIRARRCDAIIIKRACPLFVPMVEEGRTDPGSEILRLVIADYLEPVRAANVDTLILGCTHYPLIEDAIAEYMGGVLLIDPGAETALTLREYLEDAGRLSEQVSGGTYRYFVTDSAEGFARTASRFLNADIEGEVERVSLEEMR